MALGGYTCLTPFGIFLEGVLFFLIENFYILKMHRLFLLVFAFLLQFQIGHSRSTGCTEGDCNNGTGTWTYTDLTTYVGEWLDSKKHGKRTVTWPNGYKYVGEFKESKWHGSGTLTFPDGATYVGEWKDDNMHGNGTFTWANGDQYIGEFQNGNRHGQGSLTHADGSVKKGIWEKGKLINSN